VSFGIRDDDPPFPRLFHDEADIGEGGPGTFVTSLHGSTYDVRKNRMVRDNGSELPNGAPIVATGDGFGFGFTNNTRLKRASIEYRATYSTFTSSSTFNQLNRSSTLKGDSRSNTIVGNNRNGILDGGGGSDTLSGMGGNDVLCGNNGNDTLYGGTGRDLLWGGRGNDTYYGGAGRDTFVLDLLRGVDVIKDYKDGVDKIGLTNGIVYELLDIRREGRNSGIYLGNQKLGVVENTRPRDLTADDFKSISFVTIKDILTPQVMA
jgi:serralysin